MLAYFDCTSGISGDMTLSAFIDLGVPVKWLEEALGHLPISRFSLDAPKVFRHGIKARQLKIDLDENAPPLNYFGIKGLIQKSRLPGQVRDTSLAIFEKLARAEAGIHDCPVEKVHFHEIGGLDAIIDIVGTAFCLEYLGIEQVIASRVPLGSGFVKCAHGNLPVPAPATLKILEGVPVYGTGISAELVTPTGAAILATLAAKFGPMPDMVVQKSGYGAGTRELEAIPNLLRIITGTLELAKKEAIVMVETCIDDMNPEVFGYLMERLFEDGALDVYWVPVFMKKNRPGVLVQVLCHRSGQERVVGRLLSETTSTGVRFYGVERQVLERDHLITQTSFGMIQVKRIQNLDGSVRMVPEYEICKGIAREKGIPLREVYETIIREAGTEAD